jgi:hypothetical protein
MITLFLDQPTHPIGQTKIIPVVAQMGVVVERVVVFVQQKDSQETPTGLPRRQVFVEVSVPHTLLRHNKQHHVLLTDF